MIPFKNVRYLILAILPLLAYGQESTWHEHELLKYGFTYPFNTSFELENKEVRSIEELNKQISEFFIPVKLYFNAYNN